MTQSSLAKGCGLSVKCPHRLMHLSTPFLLAMPFGKAMGPVEGRASLEKVNPCGQALRVSSPSLLPVLILILDCRCNVSRYVPHHDQLYLLEWSARIYPSSPILCLVRNLVTAMRKVTHTVMKATWRLPAPGSQGRPHHPVSLLVSCHGSGSVPLCSQVGGLRGTCRLGTHLLPALLCVWLHVGSPSAAEGLLHCLWPG